MHPSYLQLSSEKAEQGYCKGRVELGQLVSALRSESRKVNHSAG
jgi:hypothetical protein